MRKYSLCFLVKEGEILLAMKKRGFGEGKWNGIGGKCEEGESIQECAIRETYEEINVVVGETQLDYRGSILFYFDSKPEWNQEVHIYVITAWEKDPEETEEMKPKWFSLDSIPYDDMWPGDRDWIPHILEGKSVTGSVVFSMESGKPEVREYNVK